MKLAKTVRPVRVRRRKPDALLLREVAYCYALSLERAEPFIRVLRERLKEPDHVLWYWARLARQAGLLDDVPRLRGPGLEVAARLESESSGVRAVTPLLRMREMLRAGVAAELRLRAGLTQREVAATVGVDRSQLSLWERRLTEPTGVRARRYAELVCALADRESAASAGRAGGSRSSGVEGAVDAAG